MNKLSNLLLVCSLLCVGASCGGPTGPNADFRVIPLPREISAPAGNVGFALYSNVKITYADSLAFEGEALRGYLAELPGVGKSWDAGEIILQSTLDASAVGPEAYRITVGPEAIVVDGASAAGVFYGVQTLRKAAYTAPAGQTPVLPAVTVADAPRFAYRGAHLDVARHPFSEAEVKSFLDMMALHGLNTFHWHLTDDQGWRIEVEKYPRLTQVGSHRDSTIVGRNSRVFDHEPVDGFFTKEQARDIVAYAAERHIEVVPEIDLPGHMLAALTAYPHLGCTGGPYGVWGRWGVSPEVLCAGNDSTLIFIDDVLNEMMDIFPSRLFHIGGDECPKARWTTCPKCQRRIAELGIKANKRFTAEERMQGVITTHAVQTLAARGRRAIGWDEILEGDIPQDAVVMSWRGVDGAVEGTEKGHGVILSPAGYCYLDYYQAADKSLEPQAWGGLVTVEKVYSLDPAEGIAPARASLVLGPQVNLWTEYVADYAKVEYQELPRMAALAEVGWTPQAQRDYGDFARRMPALWRLYDRQGYNYARHMADVAAKLTTDRQARTVTAELHSMGQVYYTLDGTAPIAPDGTPAPTAIPYTAPVVLTASAALRSAAIFDGKAGRVRTDSVSFNLATFGEVELSHPYFKHHAPAGPATLTDAQVGAPCFLTGQWVGFTDCNPTITVTLPAPAVVKEVAFTAIVDISAWIDDARAYTVELLTDDAGGRQRWVQVAAGSTQERRSEQPENELSRHVATFAPTMASKVRLNITCAPMLPQWHRDHSADAHPLVFIDEIGVN